MKELLPYLIFTGNCREALSFYAECFGGKIDFIHTFEDSPLDVPREHKNNVFNSKFQAEDVCFMASDNLPPYSTEVGTNVALFVIFTDTVEQEKVYEMLSKNGKVVMPLENKFGMVADQYGIQWMLAFK